MSSIRGSFVVGGLISVCGVLVTASLLTMWSVDRSLQAQHDDFLRRELLAISRLVEYDEDEGEVVFDADDLDIRGFADDLLCVRDAEGEFLHTSMDPPPALPVATPEMRFETMTSNGHTLRVVSWQTFAHVDPQDFADEVDVPAPAELGRFEVHLGRPNRFREPFLARFRVLSALILAGALAVTATLMTWLGRSSLRGLGRLAHSIGELGEDSHGIQLSEAGVPREALPIVRRLNRLLARLDAAVRRERELSADIAHELRTPLAGLRTTLEVGLQRPRNPHEQRDLLGAALPIIEQTEAMVEKLLTLHRVESGQMDLELEEFGLAQLVEEQLRPLRAPAQATGVELRCELEADCSVRSARGCLGILLGCLLENAFAHGRGDWIAVSVRSPGIVRIGNPGSQVDPSELSLLVERFVRGNGARSSNSGHVGLGLTLAQRIAKLLSADLILASERGGEFWAEIRLPA